MFKILDCTLRDGGNYNRWDFDLETVDRYLRAVATSGIEFIELGYRNFELSGFYGAFAYTTDAFLDEISLPAGPAYGVMIDAKNVIQTKGDASSTIDRLFRPKSESKLTFVRIAAHFHEVDACEAIVAALKSKGYLVGLNLMQAGNKSAAEISAAAHSVSQWGGVDCLYFADSIGDMSPTDVERVYAAVASGWQGEIGIHAHDNLGLALTNTLEAQRLGATWLDCTVCGMGRGAGNAQTERLLTTQAEQHTRYQPEALYDIVIKIFEPLKREFGWGSNLLYFVGARKGIHPTYIQELLADPHYGSDEIVGAIRFLGDYDGSTSFSQDVIQRALRSADGVVPTMVDTPLCGKFDGREVLLIGRGTSIEKYKLGIEQYVQSRRPIVISLNLNEAFDAALIDYYCVLHNARFLSEKHRYSRLQRPVIFPGSRFRDDEIKLLNQDQNNISYSAIVQDNKLTADTHCALIPYDLSAAYALCCAVVGGAAQVSLVGFDGYAVADQRHQEMVSILNQFQQKFRVPLVALTPSTYPVQEASVYAPVE